MTISPSLKISSSSKLLDIVGTITLKDNRDSATYFRHPWIFSGAIKDQSGSLAEGDLVDVLNSRGKFLGSGYFGEQSIAVRMLTFGERFNASTISNLVKSALNLRRTIGLPSQETTGYRIINGEGDGIPGLVVDRYADSVVIEPHTIGTWNLRYHFAQSILDCSDVKPIHIYCSARALADIEDETLLGEESTETVFLEKGLKFVADWGKSQKTGFFIDQRENRSYLRGVIKGKSVLNLFSFSGGFTLAAMAGDCREVISVDTSRSAQELLRRNLELNNFGDYPHETVNDDCFAFLASESRKFDVVIVDPPAFAKHRKAVAKATKGYEDLNFRALHRVAPGGLLFTFSCSQLISRDVLRTILSRAAARAGVSCRIIAQLHQAPCHPITLGHEEGDYLKGFVLEVE